jgi:four helix bundle protein
LAVGSWQRKQKANYVIEGYKRSFMGSFKDLTIFKKAFANAMEIFAVSKTFPVEEKYSLTDQIRRSSRSVCSNIAEAYRKRQYPAHFVSKLSDSDAENAETEVWLSFAVSCGYINNETFERLSKNCEEIGKMSYHMINYPEKYLSNKTII